jgi:hypothetical protein
LGKEIGGGFGMYSFFFLFSVFILAAPNLWYNGAHCHAGLDLRVLLVVFNHGSGTLVVQRVFAWLIWNGILELQGLAPHLLEFLFVCCSQSKINNATPT